MLDKIPFRTRIEYWFKRQNMATWFILVAIAAGVAYWPMRNMLIAQRPTLAVIVSNLTVNMILTFAIVAIVMRQIALLFKPKFPKWYPLIRIACFSIGMFGMIYWLTFWGYETRW